MLSLDPRAKAHVERAFSKQYAWADHLAVHYAGLYRSFYSLRFLLVIIATFGLFLGFYTDFPVNAVGFALQAASILAIFFFARLNERRGWHQRFLDYRYLAEQLRHMRYLSLLGLSLPPLQYPAYNSQAVPQWVDWHYRNIIRQAGLVSTLVDRDYVDAVRRLFAVQLVAGQREYYRRKSNRLAMLSKRLEKTGMTLFMLSLIVFPLRALAFLLLPKAGAPIGGMEPAAIHTLANEISLLLPAMALVFFGVRSQGEYARIAQRYAAMAGQLRKAFQELRRLKRGSSRQIGQRMKVTSGMMVDEVSDWRVVVKSKPLTPY